MAADALEVRIAHLEGACERIDRRLGAVESALQSVRTELRATRTDLLSRMDRQFFWILGLLITSILLPVALRAAGR